MTDLPNASWKPPTRRKQGTKKSLGHHSIHTDTEPGHCNKSQASEWAISSDVKGMLIAWPHKMSCKVLESITVITCSLLGVWSIQHTEEQPSRDIIHKKCFRYVTNQLHLQKPCFYISLYWDSINRTRYCQIVDLWHVRVFILYDITSSTLERVRV